jgi:CheY-like chemotaxis protein
MMKLLLVTPNQENFSDFAQALAGNNDVELTWADSGQKALDMVSVTPVDLVVTDENLVDMTGLRLALRLLHVNPMVNCSVVSSLTAEQFHEASEGLGLLAQMPPRPDSDHAEELLRRLKDLKNLTAGVKPA